ncbi:hypothetical protein HPB51_006627 [Rhipicephalus microplus]|uniref:Uncharacterized protein n=1 Tax=Rhipicephalus microplus TaxID=6941 RepID=A0A9J6E6H0_RHIMP|nr:hypothetical protein HPB51_006627 [Rhipicephalus microplus]
MGHLSIHGTLDGRDLRAFEADAVPKRGWVSIAGNCVFYRGLSVRGNIAADTVNDLMFSYDVLLKNADQSVKGDRGWHGSERRRSRQRPQAAAAEGSGDMHGQASRAHRHQGFGT